MPYELLLKEGSPPPVRGKAGLFLSHCLPPWITPACAGKRTFGTRSDSRGWDHPRVCGEKYPGPLQWSDNKGSPPRMRGKAGRQLGIGGLVGITPACAGKRPSAVWPAGWPGDHPRVCGEKYPGPLQWSDNKGSPPRMRGKAGRQLGIGGLVGITPACAGKRPSAVWPAGWPGDHPRVCGEKFHPASDRKFGRVRGTKRSSGPAPAAAPAGLAGSCPASPPWSYPPRITVSRPRP